MLGTRHEEYRKSNNELPLVVYKDITRTPFNFSSERNWHEDIEIQLCTKGGGSVLLNGKEYKFNENDIVVIESDVIHYTFSETSLTYTCLIINPEFCNSMGINLSRLHFLPTLRNPLLASFINELAEIYSDREASFRTARIHGVLLKILITLAENYSFPKDTEILEKDSFEKVKATIKYIRKNYNSKITLDELAKQVYTDKYSLCRDFKRYSGKTVTQYINSYRCLMAADFISQGSTVSEAARSCGFENLSFFTKTFKRYMGKLPSRYRNSSALEMRI